MPVSSRYIMGMTCLRWIGDLFLRPGKNMIIIHLVQAVETLVGPGLVNIFQKFPDFSFYKRGQMQDAQEQDKESK